MKYRIILGFAAVILGSALSISPVGADKPEPGECHGNHGQGNGHVEDDHNDRSPGHNSDHRGGENGNGYGYGHECDTPVTTTTEAPPVTEPPSTTVPEEEIEIEIEIDGGTEVVPSPPRSAPPVDTGVVETLAESEATVVPMDRLPETGPAGTTVLTLFGVMAIAAGMAMRKFSLVI